MVKQSNFGQRQKPLLESKANLVCVGWRTQNIGSLTVLFVGALSWSTLWAMLNHFIVVVVLGVFCGGYVHSRVAWEAAGILVSEPIEQKFAQDLRNSTYSGSQKSASKHVHCCTLQHFVAPPTAMVSW